MVAARPAVPPRLRRAAASCWPPRTWRGWNAPMAALSPADAPYLPPLPRRQPAPSSSVFRPCLETPVPGLARLAEPRTCSSSLPELRPWRSLDARTRPLLQRPARAPGVLVPVEVPGHVAVPLPEPVLDPLVPRVRARRLAPDRRLRRGDARPWPAWRDGWASTSRLGRAGARRCCSTAGAPSACAPPAGEHPRRRRGGQRRLRPRHDRAGPRPPRAAAGPTRSSRRKKFSCSTFMLYLGVEGALRRRRTTRSTSPRITSKNLRRDREPARALATIPRSTCRTPASPTRRSRRAGNSTLYVLAPVTHQHPNVDWRRERDRFRDLVLSKLAKVGLEDVERRIRFERVVTPDGLGPGLRDPPRRDVQPRPHPGADAPPAAAQSLRGPRRRLPGRRRHASGERAAGDLRVGADQLAAAARGPRHHRRSLALREPDEPLLAKVG